MVLQQTISHRFPRARPPSVEQFDEDDLYQNGEMSIYRQITFHLKNGFEELTYQILSQHKMIGRMLLTSMRT